ncbi:MAG: hypothetical protein IPN96_22680 [Anaerolineales bacterium]|nr:hypothetical protein [Anaerolineales bacterium]
MADLIKCPVCGENNFSDQEFCQFCQSRLQTGVDSLKGSDEGFKPGQAPTKKATADLEPILPQWLREARSSARDAADDDAARLPAQETARPSSPPDLLAGLQAQSGSDEEDDTPDWLASITGASPTAKKSQSDSSEVRWVELGGSKDFAQEESADENETPSWLANLASTGAPSAEKDELTDWMREASGLKPLQSQPPVSSEPAADSDTPDWLRQMAADSDAKNSGAVFDDASQNTFAATPADSDTPDWLRQMAADSDAKNSGAVFDDASQNTFAATPADSDTPDWLRQMAADSDAKNSGAVFDDASQNTFAATPADSDTPDWLRQMAADSDAKNSGAAFDDASQNTFAATPADSDTPDWLRQMAADSDAKNSGAVFDDASQNTFAATPADSDTPDWLRQMGTQGQAQSADSASFSETSFGESDAGSSSAVDTPDWLKGLGAEASPSALSSDDDWLKGLQAEKDVPSAQTEMPSWMKSDEPAAADAGLPAWLSGIPDAAPVEPVENENAAPADDLELGDIPSWLKAAAPHSSIFGETAQEPAVEPAPSFDAPADSADWLNTFKSIDTPQAPAFAMDEPVEAAPAPPAFVPDSQSGENMDSLFTDMPDWLSGSVDLPAANPAPTPMTNSDVLAAGELPAWVQAMRPVDTGVSQLSSTLLSSDQTLESRGALAGLQGVLPAAPGYAPTSKPKAYSIKLQASEEQQMHAALLEQILAAEAEPVPIASYSALRTSRSLRWVIAFLLLTIITSVLAMRTQIFTMPVGNTLDINGALNAIGSIPEGSPVLVMFDYEPARVGEMEVAAAPVFDQMLLLRHPRLTFISTNESGAILAERFITGPLAGHGYESGIRYLNLGYLPGGQMGIRAFAQNPSVSAPYAFSQSANLFSTTLTPAWTLPPLEGVTSLSQFTALILITDNADSARAWIEQTTSARGTLPFVVISSAQAAPMIQPYYTSQQISGLVSGLYGGAVYEQNNAGRPGTARTYWDAYSIGMLLAMALILGGGLWNLALGLRDRAAAREAK